MKVLAALFSSAVLAASAGLLAADDPYAPVVTLSVTPPGANAKAQELTISESGVKAIKIGNVEYKFRANIYDAKPWNNVTVTIFKGATATVADQVLGEVELKTGGAEVASKTNPVFKLKVTKVTAPPNPAAKKQ